MIHEVLAMSSKEMRILFKKREIIMKLRDCLMHIETSGDWVPEYDPTADEADEDDIRRAHQAHIVNLREQAHNMDICMKSIGGVFSFFKDHTPPAANQWFQSFLAEFESLRTVLHEDTTRKTNAQLEDQISRTLHAFTILFEMYHNIPKEGDDMTIDTENVGHTIVFQCDQMLYTFRAFASWVRLDFGTLKRKCDRIEAEIDQKIAFHIAIDNKPFWFCTMKERVYLPL